MENKQDQSVKTKVSYDEKVIQKIIASAIESIDGLLAMDGGFFSNAAEKLVNTDNETAGIHTEVGEKQVAADLSVIVEYGKDIPEIVEKIKKKIHEDVEKMTHLDVIEVNVHVADIKTKEQHEQDQVTVQDRVTDAAKTAGEFTSEKAGQAKDKLQEGADKAQDALSDGADKAQDKLAEGAAKAQDAMEDNGKGEPPHPPHPENKPEHHKPAPDPNKPMPHDKKAYDETAHGLSASIAPDTAIAKDTGNVAPASEKETDAAKEAMKKTQNVAYQEQPKNKH